MTTFMTLLAAALLAQAPSPEAGRAAADALELQVMLDRAGFSPGAIDGRMGASTRRALELFRAQRGDAEPAVPALTIYTITADDADGPFADAIPADLMEQAQLPALSYRSALEAIAERFHAAPALLQRLNPGARFTATERIRVPNVEPMSAPGGPRPASADRGLAPTGTSGRTDVVVTISQRTSSLTVTDGSGRVVFFAPVTTGSERDPLPVGEWTVTGVQFNPVFHYNPDLFWDADPSHAKAKIAPGPNNPVGLVWIDIDKPHYGIHGTPEPSAIGRAESHGCVRLTNWDALRLARLIGPGTRVVFTNQP
jgi:lipoprotein-anchoring transpeptidase ErfK/SrfK